MIVGPKRGGDWGGDSGWEVAHLLTGGHVGGQEHPWDWQDHVTEEMAADLDARLAKKRPVGFAPWPEEAS